MSATFEVDDVAPVVRIQGELDLGVATELRECIERARRAQDVKALVIDLEQVTFLDSSALKELVRPALEGCAVTLRRPGPRTRRVIELAGMAEDLTLSDE